MSYDWPVKMGTMVTCGSSAASYINQIKDYGFESYSISVGAALGDINLTKLAGEVRAEIATTGAVVSSLSAFGNPLMFDDTAQQTRDAFAAIIDAAELFGCDLVTGFAGRVVGKPIDECIPRFVEVFKPLAKQAKDKGVRIAFENCEMGGNWQSGDWNIAHTPQAWEMMFDAIDMDNVGLQWEPCHQMVKLIDPMPQLRKWVSKIFNVHGKDATILWDVIREKGIGGPAQFAFHRTPGYGDSNWADIISELIRGGFRGSIDIEGWHDPVYNGELEMTGQVKGLNYLKRCRGEVFVPNPVV